MNKRITVDELNRAYNEVNKFKINGYCTRSIVTLDLDNNFY